MVGMPRTHKKQLFYSFKNTRVASIGIGTMIVFIAMVLVAGIAASVLIQTSNNLEAQAMKSGQDTREEVSSDISVLDIMGDYASRNITGTIVTGIHNMTITVTPRSASAINLADVVIQISNGSKLCILYWDGTYAPEPSSSGLFQTSNVFDLNASSFGIIVEQDGDSSCGAANPVINKGDKALLTVNLSACFNGLLARTDVKGMVIAEHGSPGVFLFRTPATNSKPLIQLL